MRRIFIFFFAFFVIVQASAHSGKARFHVLIDTDGAADDLRTICMLLGNREIEVLAITTSEGALTSNRAAVKVKSLLRQFHHEGIPVGAGRSLQISAPIWRQQSENIDWGDETSIDLSIQSAKDVITYAIENEDEKVVIVSLGSLTNLNDVLSARPQLKENIDRVVWYTSAAKPLSGTNYDADKASADRILASGVSVEIVSAEKQAIVIDDKYVDLVASVDNVYAQKIVSTHRNGALTPVISSGHMKLWDDLVAVWLFAPELFASTQVQATVTFHILPDVAAVSQAKNTIIQILTGKPDSESRVFSRFPEDVTLFAADVAGAMKDIIPRYGHSEWRAGVLTNELHGHLGIYAIIGVKMGIRAREYFNIGVDDVEVVTHAGLVPPISCMNDGLQVSTGGTLGHGLISVSNESVRPEATFSFKGKTIRMKLKPQYAAQIREDVAEGIRLHGDLTEAYWEHIRVLAIKYWQEFSRYEIFEMSVD